MIGYIYRITNILTNQHYIGQTINIKTRLNKHFNLLRNNKHENPKLQSSWNKYGEKAFEYFYWEFQIKEREELNSLECEYIEKYEGLTEGFNLIPGGTKPPIHQKVKNEDVATFLCVLELLGDGYGKTCEQIFGWARGTASSAKRKLHYLKGWEIYENLASAERKQRAEDFIESQHLKEQALKRQLTQGGCAKAYQLTEQDYFLAFAAQQLGCTYTEVANYLEIKPATVKDWFNKRSRKREREKFNSLSEEQKSLLIGRCKIAGLSGKPKSVSSN